MTAGDGPRPARIVPFPNGELGVVWEDGHESYIPGRDLRCACACARCVDEQTGRKILDDTSVPETIEIAEMHPVGNYGVGIRWTDGHDTGIYTYERLRELG